MFTSTSWMLSVNFSNIPDLRAINLIMSQMSTVIQEMSKGG